MLVCVFKNSKCSGFYSAPCAPCEPQWKLIGKKKEGKLCETVQDNLRIICVNYTKDTAIKLGRCRLQNLYNS